MRYLDANGFKKVFGFSPAEVPVKKSQTGSHMNELTIVMPDDLLPKLHQVCQRRGLHMGDAVLGLIRNFIEIDEQERARITSEEESLMLRRALIRSVTPVK